MSSRGEHKSHRKGICFIISAPSGSGKSTLIQAVLKHLRGIEFMVSYTTRQPRSGEVNGVAYHFIDNAEFDRMLAEDAFLEWATVHKNRYGTPKAPFMRKLDEGIDMILEIDVQGAQQIRQQIANTVGIFILPHSPEVLRNRLNQRGKDSAEVIELRLQTAKSEIAHLKKYSYLIINEDIEHASQELAAIIVAERCRLEYRTALISQWDKALNAWPK